jgi:hypothetical protein
VPEGRRRRLQSASDPPGGVIVKAVAEAMSAVRGLATALPPNTARSGNAPRLPTSEKGRDAFPCLRAARPSFVARPPLRSGTPATRGRSVARSAASYPVAVLVRRSARASKRDVPHKMAGAPLSKEGVSVIFTSRQTGPSLSRRAGRWGSHSLTGPALPLLRGIGSRNGVPYSEAPPKPPCGAGAALRPGEQAGCPAPSRWPGALDRMEP